MANNKKLIEEKKLILEKLRINEQRDKAFINLQLRKLNELRQKECKAQKLKDSLSLNHYMRVVNPSSHMRQGSQIIQPEDRSTEEEEIYQKLNEKEEEMIEILMKIKSIKESKFYSQDNILKSMINYREK